MERSDIFSCVIIGAGSLPIRCAEILLESGQHICAVVSSDAEVMRWARQKEIVHLQPTANLSEHLRGGEPFDYLFSIVNEHILREDILSLPRRLAVNYHDAPLPKYAGTHATSWALMNGEQTHGISWHEITDVVDAGDILKQRLVAVAPDDTALTLNTKCFEAAIGAFAELVEELAAGNATLVKQNLDERTFFARYKRPAHGCVISFKNQAAEISRLIRALDFGAHPNPLGAAKFLVGDEFFIVAAVEVLESPPETAPGTINEIGSDFLRISTADKEIILRSLRALDGQTVSISDLVTKFSLSAGQQVPELDSETAQHLDEFYKSNSKHETFWVKKLSSLEPAAPPYANTAVSSDAPSYASATMPIPDEVLIFLKNREAELTTDDFLLASFGILLARLGAVDNFDVGYTDSEMQKEAAGLKQFFAVQVPLRVNVDCSQNFAETLKDTKLQVESIKKHRTYARDLVTRYPQFSATSDTGRKFTLPVTIEKVARLENYEPISGSELTLLVAENESECRLVYQREKFAEENITKLISHFSVLLQSIAANSEQPVAYLPLLDEAERRQLLIEWNDNQIDYPKNQCIHQLFEAQTTRTPEATALIFGEERVTYRELNRRANQLANYLRGLGVGAEVLVGVCLERSVEMIIGILGTLKAGGAYVPLDPNYPQERIAHMLEDSQASVLLTQQKLVAGLNEHRAQTVCLDGDWQRIAQESVENPVSMATANNLAYVIYTSGSTGKPKGVAIEHRNTIAFLHWATSVFTAEHLRGVLASTSVCFDLSIYEIFAPLSCGGTIVLVENVLHLPAAPAANEVTLINTVPSAITELLRIKGVPDSVRTVNLAGEPLKTSLVRQIYELGGVREVYDLYGPTEDTTYSTFTLRGEGAATIGRPIANTQAYILDRYLQPVPVGIAGELYLGGDGLARGYLSRPELTDERFIKNPFSSEPAARLYKTGDLTRRLPNGEIEYLGRIDNQVKIRGFRIELGEIEAMLLSHAAIEECVVLAREDKPGEKRLAAYVVQKQGRSVKTNELRSFLKEKLPDYMVPSAFVELERLPLTPNGKVDRKALPAPATNISDSERDFVSHRDSLELELTKIWEIILGVQPIGVSDDFFELGGHSLQAVRMFAEVEKTFNKNIPLATLFQAGTIEKLAAILRQEGWAEPESSLVAIQPKGSKPPFFCVHAKGGNVLFYRDLARHLGEDQPFYGIQARRLGGRQVGHASVEEMAE